MALKWLSLESHFCNFLCDLSDSIPEIWLFNQLNCPRSGKTIISMLLHVCLPMRLVSWGYTHPVFYSFPYYSQHLWSGVTLSKIYIGWNECALSATSQALIYQPRRLAKQISSGSFWASLNSSDELINHS